MLLTIKDEETQIRNAIEEGMPPVDPNDLYKLVLLKNTF